MFKVNQLVRWCGMPMVIEAVGSNTETGADVLCLQYPCVVGVPPQERAMTIPVITNASEVDGLIGNNYQAKQKCSR